MTKVDHDAIRGGGQSESIGLAINLSILTRDDVRKVLTGE